jgi:hypothetical protein
MAYIDWHALEALLGVEIECPIGVRRIAATGWSTYLQLDRIMARMDKSKGKSHA